MTVKLAGKWEADRIADVLEAYAVGRDAGTSDRSSWATDCANRLRNQAVSSREYFKRRTITG